MTSLTSIDCVPHFPSVTVHPTSCFLKAMKTVQILSPLRFSFQLFVCLSKHKSVEKNTLSQTRRAQAVPPPKNEMRSFHAYQQNFPYNFFYLISEGHFGWTLNLTGCFKINFVWQSSPKLIQFGEHSLIQGTKAPQLRSFSSAALTHGGL